MAVGSVPQPLEDVGLPQQISRRNVPIPKKIWADEPHRTPGATKNTEPISYARHWIPEATAKAARQLACPITPFKYRDPLVNIPLGDARQPIRGEEETRAKRQCIREVHRGFLNRELNELCKRMSLWDSLPDWAALRQEAHHAHTIVRKFQSRTFTEMERELEKQGYERSSNSKIIWANRYAIKKAFEGTLDALNNLKDLGSWKANAGLRFSGMEVELYVHSIVRFMDSIRCVE